VKEKDDKQKMQLKEKKREKDTNVQTKMKRNDLG